MKQFISILLLGCFVVSVAFGALTKSQVKNKPMKYKVGIWEETSGYTLQARSENTMFRYKTILGGKLSARVFESQKNEVLLGCSILNKMASFGMPDSYKAA